MQIYLVSSYTAISKRISYNILLFYGKHSEQQILKTLHCIVYYVSKK